jgi:predicted DNA-binding transcriptional regulator YafY
LETLGSKYGAVQLREQVDMDNRLKAANEEIFLNVEKVCTAIATNRCIRFKYFEWNSRKQRLLRKNGEYYDISPIALNWFEENYYLVAYDNDAEKVKHFRVDKMLDVTVTERLRDNDNRRNELDMATYSRQVFGMYGGENCNVRIRCDNSLASVVIDRFGQEVTILSNTDTYFEFAAKVMISPTFYSWVMGFGNKMKIISPDYVAHELAKTVSDILDVYEL